MQTTPWKLRPAQAEVNRAAHDQDLIEVPKRAMLDRRAEALIYQIPIPGEGTKVIWTPPADI